MHTHAWEALWTQEFDLDRDLARRAANLAGPIARLLRV